MVAHPFRVIHQPFASKETTMNHPTPHDTINIGALGVIRFLIEATDSNGSACVFEASVPRNSGMPAAHSHDGFEETIYGLDGATTWTIDGDPIEVAPGEAVCIARGQIHSFVNRGRADAKFLAIATPGLFGHAYFEEIGEILDATPDEPPNLAAIEQAMLRHGLTPGQRVAQ
jgi:mannose-6-phosphate isomerase-like protein (cupin superfamily)